jgi:D-alanine-D-alanine ligase
VSRLRVAVLMGGTSAERAISLSTGRQILAALDPSRYEAMALDAAALSGQTPLVPPSAPVSALKSAAVTDAPSGVDLVPADFGRMARAGGGRPDVVIIALHGKGGEDGTIQGALDLLGIPYTGSGVLASALAMDKAMTNAFLRGSGIPVPQDIVLRRTNCVDDSALREQVERTFGWPAVVKPNAQGSTIGCSIVREPSNLGAAVEEAFTYDDTVLVEDFIAGVEITAGVLGNDRPEALPLIEIDARGGFYDYEAKYAPGGSSHVIPARISETASQRAREYALACHTLLGCRGMSRTDMMVVGDQPYVLEINTIPGMTPTSLLPDAAKAAGIGFSELLDRLIGYALEGRQLGA